MAATGGASIAEAAKRYHRGVRARNMSPVIGQHCMHEQSRTGISTINRRGVTLYRRKCVPRLVQSFTAWPRVPRPYQIYYDSVTPLKALSLCSYDASVSSRAPAERIHEL